MAKTRISVDRPLGQDDRLEFSLAFLLLADACSFEIGTQIARQGKDVDETNTGVPSGRVLDDVRSTIIVTESWISGSNGGSRIIRDKYFHSGAGLIITVDGFTVQYCKFFGKGGISPDPNDGGGRIGKLAPYAKDMIVGGNVFGRGEQRYCGIYGAATAFDCYAASNVWKGNTWGKCGPYWQKGDPEEGDAVQAPPPT